MSGSTVATPSAAPAATAPRKGTDMPATPQVQALYRYPVKGLSPEPLTNVRLEADRGFPLDRAYAVTDGSWAFDPARPAPVPKTKFLMLARHERLAALRTRLDDATRRLTIQDASGRVSTFALGDAAGCAAASAFFAAFMGDAIAGTPAVVCAPGHQFTDVSVHSATLMRSISLINLASVRALGAKLGRVIDPARFRGNVVFDSDAPWLEFDWMDREFRLGEARVRAIRRTRRCPATDVNPDTFARDTDIPRELRTHFGHGDLGIYVEVLEPGRLNVGDTIVPV